MDGQFQETIEADYNGYSGHISASLISTPPGNLVPASRATPPVLSEARLSLTFNTGFNRTALTLKLVCPIGCDEEIEFLTKAFRLAAPRATLKTYEDFGTVTKKHARLRLEHYSYCVSHITINIPEDYLQEALSALSDNEFMRETRYDSTRADRPIMPFSMLFRLSTLAGKFRSYAKDPASAARNLLRSATGQPEKSEEAENHAPPPIQDPVLAAMFKLT